MTNTDTHTAGNPAAISTSIAPWLSVRDGAKAVAFYKAAFGATELYRLEQPDGGLVVQLAVESAAFWISSEASSEEATNENVGGGTVRIILTVADPDALFARALQAGAAEIFPVGEDFGWRLGRLADPFGLHWEIGHQLAV